MVKYLLLLVVAVSSDQIWSGPWVTGGIKRLAIEDRPWYRIEFSKEWIEGERLVDLRRVSRELGELRSRADMGEDLAKEIATLEREQTKEFMRAKEMLPKISDLVPYDLEHCAFGLDGSRLDPPDRGIKALRNLSGRFGHLAVVDLPLLGDGAMFANDVRMFAVHDSIVVCLEELSKKDVEAYCVNDCMYRLCDWGARPFDYSSGRCTSRSGESVECRGSLLETCKYVNENK
jgi:hypothetical protein